MKKRCEDCIYFVPPESGPHGKCHRFPPDYDGNWPEVGKYSWCGEFSAKQEHAHDKIHDAMGRLKMTDDPMFRRYVDRGGISM